MPVVVFRLVARLLLAPWFGVPSYFLLSRQGGLDGAGCWKQSESAACGVLFVCLVCVTERFDFASAEEAQEGRRWLQALMLASAVWSYASRLSQFLCNVSVPVGIFNLFRFHFFSVSC